MKVGPLEGPFLAAVVLAISACSGSPRSEDSSISPKLEQIHADKNPARLADLTNFDWDRVYLFDSYTSAETVNAEAGGVILSSPIGVPENEDLLVFDLHGSPVRVVPTPNFFDFAARGEGSGGWSRDVLVRPNCDLLYLLDPGDQPPLADCSR
jgi:hypothetical protein